MTYRGRIAFLSGILIAELIWAATARAACPHYTVTNEVVSYGVVHSAKACVLDLHINRGEVVVKVDGEGIMRSGFER